MNLLKLLQRVTYSGNKILFIDGLRFFAVVSVFISHFIDYYADTYPEFDEKTQLSKYEYISATGVFLFFSISGFIISLPFIKQYIFHEKKVDVKQFFIRRLTRLEPPYIILLTLFFILQITVFKSRSFSDELPHYLASLIYSHNLIYQEMPTINPLLWSLEIEIQFYILAPIILLIFKLNKIVRRGILFFLIFGWGYLSFLPDLGFRNLLNYLPYFLVGILAADIYLEYQQKKYKNIFIDGLCFISIVAIFINPNGYIITTSSLVLLTLSDRSIYFIKILERKIIYIIGGLCYSIYMLHQKLIYVLHAFYSSLNTFFKNYYLDFSIKLIICSIVVFLCSAIFFIFVERPTMKKNWWKYRDLKKLFFE